MPATIIQIALMKVTNYSKLERLKYYRMLSQISFYFSDSMDFGIFQMSAVIDRKDLKRGQFWVLTNFGVVTYSFGIKLYKQILFIYSGAYFTSSISYIGPWSASPT